MEEIPFDNESDISQQSDIFFDSNNNTNESADNNINKPSSSSKKIRRTKRLSVNRTYGLRPRTQLRRPSYDCEGEEKEKEPSIPVRKTTRGKTRSPVAAKCRRLTANARERQRMKEINEAFSTLRGVLPSLQTRPSARISMTKIRTLRLAASYIQTLSDLLSGAEESPDLASKEQIYEQDDQNGFPNTIENYQNTSFKQTCNPTDGKVFCPRNDIIQEPVRESFVSGGKSQELQFLNQIENKIPQNSIKHPSNPIWEEEMQASDEELFSLLEKEVLNMRNKQQQSIESNTTLPELNWSDDLLPMGCK